MMSLFMANNRIKSMNRNDLITIVSKINPLNVFTKSGSCLHNAGSPHNGCLKCQR